MLHIVAKQHVVFVEWMELGPNEGEVSDIACQCHQDNI